MSQKEHDDAVSAEQIGAADVKRGAGAADRGAPQPRVHEGRSAGVGHLDARAFPRRARWSPGRACCSPAWCRSTRSGSTSASRTTSSARLQKEVEAGRLKLPKNGNVEVALRLADGSDVSAYRASSTSPTCASRTATGTRRRAPSCRTRTASCARASSCAWSCSGATRPNAVAVPQRAVLEGPQGKFVYVVNEKSTAEPRPVQVGEWAGDAWIITSGLKGGERVIVDGVMKIGPGRAGEGSRETPAAEKPTGGEAGEEVNVLPLLHRPADLRGGPVDLHHPRRPRGDARAADRAVPGDLAAGGHGHRDLPRRLRAGARVDGRRAARERDQRRRGHALHELDLVGQRHGADPGHVQHRHRHRQGARSTSTTAPSRSSRACRWRCAARASRWRRARPPSSRCSRSTRPTGATTTSSSRTTSRSTCWTRSSACRARRWCRSSAPRTTRCASGCGPTASPRSSSRRAT